MNWTWKTFAPLALAVTLVSGLFGWQRCSYQRELDAKSKATTAADSELVAAKTQLATEHVAAAQRKARVTVRTAQTEVAQEIQHAEGDSDLVDYLSAFADGKGE